ncbi:sulfatase [uncultured Rubinisphaera sp.]|uniref:sulfatase family protein n=1 Tax=uncultured Rubinisphaera sp. TaxID=1678686 RepID=UPI000C1217F7|nr:acetylglucosamine-6-sulfatase [Rubinisphaera sp.]HCS54906.1 acetylglucosamine-6-sulfatase [Planctomycetaceae bacterium]|tara:strand:- start:19325 stop:20812 length:1488 start_codon:yes stop_codon:yes gene_type:complete
MRRKLLLLVAVAMVFSITGYIKVANAAHPNVIFILTDDQRWDQLGCAGHPYLKTPHIDRLAAEGVQFSNMFITTSLCSPSRASYLSGLYASSHGVVNNFTDYPRDLDSFPKRLQDAGYETAYIGKWHMGEADDSRRPGFDYWVTHKGQGQYYDTEFNVNGERKVVPGYYTTVVTDMAVEWMKQQPKDKPYMLILGHKAPHTPFTPEKKYEHIFDDIEVNYPHSAFKLEGKPKWIEQRLDTWHGIYGPLYGFREKFPDRSAEAVLDFEKFSLSYTASIKSVDDSVGRMYELLKQRGVLDNTVVVFAGDNGMFLGEHGMSDKRAMHEPSIRVPMIVRYPKVAKPGSVIPQQVLNIDLAPSLVELCDAKPMQNIHGSSWVPLLKGETKDWRDAWFYEYNYEKQFPYTPNVRGIRTDRWKYMRYPHGDGSPDKHMAELYDLENDPGEMHNLIDKPEHKELISKLKKQLDDLIAKTGGKSWETLPMDEGIKTELPDADIR